VCGGELRLELGDLAAGLAQAGDQRDEDASIVSIRLGVCGRTSRWEAGE
jgi:hypothetical protein